MRHFLVVILALTSLSSGRPIFGWFHFLRHAPTAADLSLGGDTFSSLAARLRDTPVLVHPTMGFDYRLREYFYSLELKLHL